MAGVLQVFGIGLTLFGVSVVRTSLQRVADAAIAAKEGVARWAAMGRQQLRHWWQRLRGREVVYTDTATGTINVSGRVSMPYESERGRVDPGGISDREWLAYLDNEVAALWVHICRTEHDRTADRSALDERLAADHDGLRGEIVRATRQGWQLVVAGLVYSAIGTAVGIFA